MLKHPAIVLGLYLPGIDIIKSLKRKGIKCIGIDNRNDVPGHYLNGVKTHICPDPAKDEEGWVHFMINIGKKFTNKPVLLITSDQFVKSTLSNENKLDSYFLFNRSHEKIIEKLMSKKDIVSVAQQTNIPIPKTYFPNTHDDIDLISEKVGYPCIIKPQNPNKWRTPEAIKLIGYSKVLLANNQNELNKHWEKIFSFDDQVIIQEVIKGPDHNLLYFVTYINKDRKCLGYFCGQKLRITPIHFGSASYMKTIDPEPVKEYCLKLLIDNGYEGPAGVEMKKDEDTGEYKLVEVNTRFGLWDVIGKKIGVNIFYIAYLDLIGETPKQAFPINKKIYWLSVSRDRNTFFEYYNENLITYWQWFKSFLGKVYFSDIYWSEPKVMYFLYLKPIINKIQNKFQNV